MVSWLKNNALFVVFKNLKLESNVILRAIIGLGLIVLIVLMFPQNESIEYSYQVGSVWTNNDLTAPFSYPIYKDQQRFRKEEVEALASVYPIVERRQGIEQAQVEHLRLIMDTLRAFVDVHRQSLRTHSVNDSLRVLHYANVFSMSPTSKQWSILAQWRAADSRKTNDPLSKFEQTLKTILADIIRVGVLDSGAARQSHKQLALRRGTVEEIVDKEKLLDAPGALAEIEARLSADASLTDIAVVGKNVLQTVLRPNIVFNQSETNRLLQVAKESVPRTLGFVQENERIVSKNDRITEETKQKLDSFRRAKAERGSQQDALSQRAGVFFHVTLVVGLFGVYLFLFRKTIFQDNAMLTLVALLLLMETFFAHLSLSVYVSQPIQYLIFVPAASMLLATIFDTRVAFYGTVTIAFLVAGIRGNDYSIALASVIAGTLAAYTVRDIRNRRQIFRSIGFIFLAYSVTIVSLAFERFESIETTLTELSFALANAVFSPVLTYGLLIFFERVFHVATDLTLLELSDFNHPLLRQLSEKTPGTFHHSVTIGNLAEAAAEAIRGNAILARVGAYYHDIGKTLKPEYYVENQTGSRSKHTKLRPRMSALVIISHVKEGMELARQHGLPEKVIDFIPQHHGTNRIPFFYDKALKQAAARKNPKDTIHEEDFCYPGPKPQTKETAIVMLADLVEASTRTIEEMTPQRLEQAIDNLVKQRFVEGQLDECELTLRELTKIKEAFFKILIGIHHQRIQYPEQPPETPRPEKRPEPDQSMAPQGAVQDANTPGEAKPPGEPEQPKTEPESAEAASGPAPGVPATQSANQGQ